MQIPGNPCLADDSDHMYTHVSEFFLALSCLLVDAFSTNTTTLHGPHRLPRNPAATETLAPPWVIADNKALKTCGSLFPITLANTPPH